MRKRTSIIWTISRANLAEIVKNSKTITSILKHFGLPNIGGNYRTLKIRLNNDGIDYSHIPLGSKANQGIKFTFLPKLSLTEILCEESRVRITSKIKKRLIREGILSDAFCQICHSPSSWQNKPLVLILDHINGKNNDNRRENLRLICPNCNSQTDTFAGRNLLHKKSRINCKSCGKKIKDNKTEMCKNCSNKAPKIDRRKVIDRPSKEEIEEMLKTMSWTAIGRKYGVSDNAVRKWIK